MIELLHESIFLYFSSFLTLIDKYIRSAAEMCRMGSVGFVHFLCWLGGLDC